MDYIALGELDYQKGVEKQFLQKINSDWQKWKDFATKLGSQMSF